MLYSLSTKYIFATKRLTSRVPELIIEKRFLSSKNRTGKLSGSFEFDSRLNFGNFLMEIRKRVRAITFVNTKLPQLYNCMQSSSMIIFS